MVAAYAIQALVLLGLSQGGTAQPQPQQAGICAATPVSVRLPPTFGASAHWIPPPLGWDMGYWYQTNSSSPNPIMRNLQYSTLPLEITKPAGTRSDLSSFQIVGNDTVLTSYGTDTPTHTPAVYTYAGTGILDGATDSLEILAWGYDCRGVGYRISYSTYTALTYTPASIDVLSRGRLGPDSATLSKIQSGLVKLGNANVTALAKAIGPGVQDGGRDGMLPVQKCDAYCQSNEDLLALLSYSDKA